MLAENIKVAISSMKHLNYKENTIFLNEKQFEFDYLFFEKSKKTQYAYCFSKFITSTISGYNNTIISYGKSKSGKSFSLGFHENISLNDEDKWGVLQRALKQFCSLLDKKNTKLYLTLTEMENENSVDLLADRAPCKIGEILNQVICSNTAEMEIKDFKSSSLFISFQI